MKTCTKCKIEKEFEDFHKDKNKKDGLCYKCKNCKQEYQKEHKEEIRKYNQKYQEENKDEIKQKKQKYYIENQEKISQQNKEYYKENEEIIKQRNEKYRKENLEEIKKQKKEYRLNNPDKIKQQKQEYYEENKEQINKKQKEYRKENKEKRKEYLKVNKEKINQQTREYQKEKYKNDPIFKLQCDLRSLNRRALKYGYKSASTQELLGCTWEEAIIYIESLFQPGMTWNNWTKKGWHLDHIKPIAAFTDLNDPIQQRECCHFTNLRPLWAEENLKKSSIHNGFRHYKKKTYIVESQQSPTIEDLVNPM